jgi:hypothetical protein
MSTPSENDAEAFAASVLVGLSAPATIVTDRCEKARAACAVLCEFQAKRVRFHNSAPSVREEVFRLSHDAFRVAIEEGGWLAERFYPESGGVFAAARGLWARPRKEFWSARACFTINNVVAAVRTCADRAARDRAARDRFDTCPVVSRV